MSTASQLVSLGDLSEVASNTTILYQKRLESLFTERSVMKRLYRYRNMGRGQGQQFQINESLNARGVTHVTGETDEPYTGQQSPGYSKTVTVRRMTFEIPISEQFIWHNKYPEQLSNIITDIAESSYIRLEHDLASPFTYCTSTSYTDIDGNSVDVSSGDSLSLANASHTLVNSSSTYRNRVANGPQLSSGSLELAENLFIQQLLDNNGNRVYVYPKLLVLASDRTTYNVAQQIIKSRAPMTAPNANVFNPYMGAYEILVSPAIDSTFTVGGSGFIVDTTKSKQWMLFDDSNTGLELIVTKNPTVMAPTPSNGGVEFLRQVDHWFTEANYIWAVVDPRCCVISTADGSG